jgi:hypothetical protein
MEIKVNGKPYEYPPDQLTLGEMCDAEQHFGVDFNAGPQSGMRLAAALLFIVIRRQDKTVTVEDVRNLDPAIFEALVEADASPPPTDEPNGSSEPSPSDSAVASAGSERDRNGTGSPGSGTTSTSGQGTSATSPPRS